MANIWFCRDGNSPSAGDVVTALPFKDCAARLAITEASFRTDMLQPPRLTNVDGQRPAFNGYHHVVVELSAAEAQIIGWKPGFYLSPLLPEEANEKLALDQR